MTPWLASSLRAVVALATLAFAARPGTAEATSNDAAWRADIEYVRSELPRRHKNAFFHISRAAFDAAATSLSASLPDLSDADAAVGIYRLVALPATATRLRRTTGSPRTRCRCTGSTKASTSRV